MSLTFTITPTSSHTSSTFSTQSSRSNMSSFFRSLGRRSHRSKQDSAATPTPMHASPLQQPGGEKTSAPPPYSESIDPNATAPIASNITSNAHTPITNPFASNPFRAAPASATDSQYAFLSNFDTIFLIDDSGSMCGRSWRETAAALTAITPVCTSHDSDGIDIYFLNHRNQRSISGLAAGGYHNVNTVAAVGEIFASVRPMGGTPTGSRLNQILKPYIAQLESSVRAAKRRNSGNSVSSLTTTQLVKPLNIIVITDGVPSDDVESVIVRAARKLDDLDAEPWQVGIQFFQVGEEPDAAEDLRELDDALSTHHGVRDIVDTVPWSGQSGSSLSSEGILKVVLGSVNRRLDRRRGTDARMRA